jgi:Xaa-Pro aminopeptidase
LWAWCDANDAAYLYVQSLPNIRWMTTFSGSAATAVIDAAERQIHLFVDGRYVTQAEEQCAASGAPADVCVVQQPSEKTVTIRKIVGMSDIVFDPRDLTVAEHQQLIEQVGTKLRPVHHPFGVLRRRKDDAELARIARSALIADAALLDVCGDGLTGRTEREVRNRLDAHMLENGADRTSFDTIVAGGPNSAMPHHRPSDRVIGASDVVIIDMGAEVEGYRSDITRTYVPATASGEIRHFADVVREAQALGVSSMAPGVDTFEVDSAVRAVFRAHGVEEYFSHGSGHGVGLVIHEEPFINRRQRANLESGEVVTMEPGLYRVGVGGVRIEDLVLITTDGREVLTHSPKELSCLQ